MPNLGEFRHRSLSEEERLRSGRVNPVVYFCRTGPKSQERAPMMLPDKATETLENLMVTASAVEPADSERQRRPSTEQWTGDSLKEFVDEELEPLPQLKSLKITQPGTYSCEDSKEALKNGS
ncbi:hypothetical protein EIP86_010945 [Pleurotus ostreatoroseus]|nr:hypothetical protein EIP86_002543 [Pleurotus ostreatoroseus]KAF7799703.1 hypothetical protein EIP86_010945 [Pleurotus ostreatoroseus]